MYFIREAMQDLMAFQQQLLDALPVKPEPDEDIEDLKQELPPALDRVVDGLSRIAEIVRSMKDFSPAVAGEERNGRSLAREKQGSLATAL